MTIYEDNFLKDLDVMSYESDSESETGLIQPDNLVATSVFKASLDIMNRERLEEIDKIEMEEEAKGRNHQTGNLGNKELRKLSRFFETKNFPGIVNLIPSGNLKLLD
jgi:hypothetical protein